MLERRPRTIRKRNQLVVAAQNRLAARKRAGVATSEALSSVMCEYIEAVKGNSGELNVEKLKKIGTRKRGAPIGNANRVTHGERSGDLRRLRADIRAYVQGGRDIVAQWISHGGGGSPDSAAALPRLKSKTHRHRFRLKLSSLDLQFPPPFTGEVNCSAKALQEGGGASPPTTSLRSAPPP